jgi:hypothetical protein
MFCKTRLIGNQCNMSRKLSQLFRANAGVNAAGAIDHDFQIGVIARSRSTLGSS